MLIAYLRKRIVWAGILLYAGIGIVLEAFTAYDILPPCLWHRLFGGACPGCGLTTAFTHLVRLEFRAAIDAHPLSPLIALLLAACIVIDYRKFVQRS